MRLIVIVVTAGRKEVLCQALKHLEFQTRLPDLLVVSAPDEHHVDGALRTPYPLAYVFGASGCTAQRNKALGLEVVRGAEIIVFFDDDFIPAMDYLERVEAAFIAHPDWTVLTGRVVADGINGTGMTFEEGKALAMQLDSEAAPRHELIRFTGAYGCNMAYRGADLDGHRFDERLPLYGWQEDTDFSRRVARGRPVVRAHALRGVHLGVRRGRVSGVRFGYSQIVNPLYLVGKGSGTAIWAMRLVLGNVVANLAKALRPEPHIDRAGRLKGNLIALGHVLRGRVDPEYILRL